MWLPYNHLSERGFLIMLKQQVIMSLLQQGLHAVRHGGFAEAARYFTQVRMHLSTDYVELATLLDIFLQRNAD